jgi:hypothetical protein
MNANDDPSSERLSRAKQYHGAIKTALLREWDPIGVSQIPEAQDEYDSYVPAIYKLLITRRPQQEVYDYLWWLETEHMGLRGDRQATEQFSDRLLRIPQEIAE